MNLLYYVLEKENKFLAEVKMLKDEGNPIYIYGAANGGRQVTARLRLYQEKINCIVDRDCWAGNHVVDNTYITYGWVTENFEKLQWMFQRLKDEKSRKTLAAFLNQKISMDYRYLKETKSDCQYFDEDIISLSEHEVFVDCGAYDGDSAMAFLEALKRRGVKSYNAIISFEPDKGNYQKLRDRRLKSHTCICKGVSDAVGTVYFSEKGTSGKIADKTNVEGTPIELDTIDHAIQGQPATLIKMDIEGEELAALQGARDTIKRWKPKLAVCIYHKKEDLWEIAEYIHQLNPEYKLYMRNYEDTVTELVLYAVVG